MHVQALPEAAHRSHDPAGAPTLSSLAFREVVPSSAVICRRREYRLSRPPQSDQVDWSTRPDAPSSAEVPTYQPSPPPCEDTFIWCSIAQRIHSLNPQHAFAVECWQMQQQQGRRAAGAAARALSRKLGLAPLAIPIAVAVWKLLKSWQRGKAGGQASTVGTETEEPLEDILLPPTERVWELYDEDAVEGLHAASEDPMRMAQLMRE
jgi:hypothetical protein